MSEKNYQDISGIVLAGGKSKRMGEDKGLISYYGKAQREYCYDLLESLALGSVHISCRADQQEELTPFAPLVDPPGKVGPIFILNHAFEKLIPQALLLLPCDVPLIDKASLEYLLSNRKKEKIATAFISPVDKKPEPLLAIWEAHAIHPIKAYIEKGNYSPRMLLMEAEAHLIEAPFPEKLQNVNRPEEAKKIQAYLSSSSRDSRDSI